MGDEDLHDDGQQPDRGEGREQDGAESCLRDGKKGRRGEERIVTTSLLRSTRSPRGTRKNWPKP